MVRNIYICLILDAPSYLRGVNDTINLINNLFPANTLIIEKYVSSGIPTETDAALDDFFNKYTSGDRIIISTFTSILLEINIYLEINKLDIISISLSASSTIIKGLNNALTYAYFNQYEVMSFYMFYKDYQMKNVKILFEENTLNKVFFTDIINLMKFQGNLLGINVEVEFLEVDKKYKFKERTAILLLADSKSIPIFINDNFLKQIPCDSYISLTDLNTSTRDIFKDIPTFVFVPVPLNYTTTTQLVYESVTNKQNIYFIVYPLFDILYTLDFISKTIVPLTLINYISLNPFTSIPAAWTNSSSFIIDISGSEFGTFDCVFTKNVLVEDNLELFNKVNNGGTGILPDSLSICKTVGIVPFFLTNTYYCEQNYHKIYDRCGKLIAVRFDKNSTSYFIDSKQILFNIAEDVENKFLIQYEKDGFFSYLEKVINLSDINPPLINQTLNKKIIKSIVK